MDIDLNEKMEEVEKKLQFVVMLALFFPVVIEALFRFAEVNQKDISASVLQLGMTIFFAVTSYLVFEWQKQSLSSRQLDYLSWVSVSTAVCFSFVVLFLATFTTESNQWLTSIGVFTYPFLFGGFVYLPVVNLFVMIGNVIETISNFIIKRIG